MKKAKILFFVNGFAPSAEDYALASKMNANVSFRNGQAVAVGGLEDCDGVAGAVPPAYKSKPSAEEAIKALEEVAKKIDADEVAPVLKKKHKESE